MVLLIGNHDAGYIRTIIRQNQVSGYQPKMMWQFHQLFNENIDLFQMAYSFDNYLCTHAGVSQIWLKNNGWEGKKWEITNITNFVNDLWQYRPKVFEFTGLFSSTGDEKTQPPTWIRPSSLIDASQGIKNKGIIQIVGHTNVNNLILDNKKLKGYILTDTFDTSQEYLIIDDNELIIQKI